MRISCSRRCRYAARAPPCASGTRTAPAPPLLGESRPNIFFSTTLNVPSASTACSRGRSWTTTASRPTRSTSRGRAAQIRRGAAAQSRRAADDGCKSDAAISTPRASPPRRTVVAAENLCAQLYRAQHFQCQSPAPRSLLRRPRRRPDCFKQLGKRVTAVDLFYAAVSSARRQAGAARFYRALKEPRMAEACLNLGSVVAELGEFEEAAAAYARGLRMREWDARTAAASYNNLGAALRELGRHDEAERHFATAVAHPELPRRGRRAPASASATLASSTARTSASCAARTPSIPIYRSAVALPTRGATARRRPWRRAGQRPKTRRGGCGAGGRRGAAPCVARPAR